MKEKRFRSIKNVLKEKSPKMIMRIKQIRNGINRIKKPVIIGELSKQVDISNRMGTDRGQAIDRLYIEEFLNKNRKYIQGNVLEIGDDEYSSKIGGKRANVTVMTYDKSFVDGEKTIFGDLTRIDTLPKHSIDCFICTQTLNFIYDVNTAVKGIKHLLSEGGTALITVSGLSQISPYDYPRWGDYWRFTDHSLGGC